MLNSNFPDIKHTAQATAPPLPLVGISTRMYFTHQYILIIHCFLLFLNTHLFGGGRHMCVHGTCMWGSENNF